MGLAQARPNKNRPFFTGGLDYDEVLAASTTYDVTFEPDRKRRSPIGPCTTITILADDLVEHKEYFNAVLSTTDESVFLLPQSTTIYIENNDSKHVNS